VPSGLSPTRFTPSRLFSAVSSYVVPQFDPSDCATPRAFLLETKGGVLRDGLVLDSQETYVSTDSRRRR
jgi:hypothetical protein